MKVSRIFCVFTAFFIHDAFNGTCLNFQNSMATPYYSSMTLFSKEEKTKVVNIVQEKLKRYGITLNTKKIVEENRLDLHSVLTTLSSKDQEKVLALVSVFEWLTHLKLDENNLKKVSRHIFRLENLKYLDLSGNCLTTLPKEIKKLVNLQRLVLDDNNLKVIPKQLGKLVNLEFISLDQNSLMALPPEMGQLVNLVEISADNNSLEELPESIEKLRKLKVISLRFNRLEVVPACLKTSQPQIRLDLAGNPCNL